MSSATYPASPKLIEYYRYARRFPASMAAGAGAARAPTTPLQPRHRRNPHRAARNVGASLLANDGIREQARSHLAQMEFASKLAPTSFAQRGASAGKQRSR